ncbi:hypothetical protein OROGR_023845 [Orobanche gracilis]
MHSCSLEAKIKMNLDAQVIEATAAKKPERKKPQSKELKAKRANSDKGKQVKDPNKPNSLSLPDYFRKEFKEANPDSKDVKREIDKSVQESRDEKSEVSHEMGGGSKEATEEAGAEKASKSPAGDAAVKSDSATESDGKVVREMEGGDGKSSSKNNESSVVESQKSANVEEEEEDLGWDEIEDLSSIDEKKGTQSGNASQFAALTNPSIYSAGNDTLLFLLHVLSSKYLT